MWIFGSCRNRHIQPLELLPSRNYKNGNLTVRFDGKVCDSNGNCFKFKTEIKAYYDADYYVCTIQSLGRSGRT